MNINVEEQIARIRDLREEVSALHQKAKERMEKLQSGLKSDPDALDFQDLQEVVKEIFCLVGKNEFSFAYQAYEVNSYEDYLIHHSIGVCTLGAEVLKKFNERFGQVVNNQLSSFLEPNLPAPASPAFICYQDNEVLEILLGFLLHDLGMFVIPASIMDKSGTLTQQELELIRSHSFQQGAQLLKKNKVLSTFLFNIISYHHAPLYDEEHRSYPRELLPGQIPAYVKVCKLVDIFNAITAKRPYQEAVNPISAITEIVRAYSNKDPYLHLILAAFVKAVGVYPPGSVVCLLNGQQAFILDSSGPVIIPITDSFGNPLLRKHDPIDLGEMGSSHAYLNIDRRKPPLSPLEYQKILPDYLK
jgi:HD-GYP domain-containing protein (c-di-GMP phosphodiesterase class II)